MVIPPRYGEVAARHALKEGFAKGAERSPVPGVGSFS